MIAHTMDELQEQVIASVCDCYKGYIIEDWDNLTMGLVQNILDEPYFLHAEAGDTHKDCPEMAIARAEYIAEMQMEHERED